MKNTTILPAILLLSTAGVAQSQERRFEAGYQLAYVSQYELDSNDFGVGGRFTFRPTPVLGIEGELNFYPSDIPDRNALTSSRLEGLFGVTVGPRFEHVAVFGKARAGFMRFAEAPAPVACILIYPPPVGCVLASGHTSPALDLGGGFEFYPSQAMALRVDVSSLYIRYPGPAFNRDREAFDEDFWGSNLRVMVGLGYRF